MENIYIKNLKKLFETRFKQQIRHITLMPQSGSYRKYYRIVGEKNTVIGTFNEDKDENIAFLSFSKHFKSKNLSVPEVYAEDLKNNIYLQEDLSNISLYDFLKTKTQDGNFPIELINKYKIILEKLLSFQFKGTEGLDWSKCYPRNSFDKQSMMWDLNYFKYLMLKIAKIPFNEQLLENDFNKFADFLTSADSKYFLYRDFQSRNIMLKDGEPFFIDYQGGRKGAIYYDLASLLYDAKAKIPETIREQLVEFYFEKIQNYKVVDKNEFFKYYYSFALIRIMQAFGAYGFRGIVEKKSHFLQSIPPAIKNLKYILDNKNIDVQIPELKKTLFYFVNNSTFINSKNFSNKLTITIKSFSFIKNGYPKDAFKHGGGFVFDCRFLHNPGRIERYKTLSGLDKPVIEFLDAAPDVETFITNSFSLVKEAVNSYIKRDLSNLAVSFGCTGGQHRSVYSAEKMKTLIDENYKINVTLEHENSNNWHTGNSK